MYDINTGDRDELECKGLFDILSNLVYSFGGKDEEALRSI